ncbi:TPA: hypothetical protein ACKQGI_002824, partial [Pseudomonas aeruginosa]
VSAAATKNGNLGSHQACEALEKGAHQTGRKCGMQGEEGPSSSAHTADTCTSTLSHTRNVSNSSELQSMGKGVG